jgi:hypothetical protein
VLFLTPSHASDLSPDVDAEVASARVAELEDALDLGTASPSASSPRRRAGKSNASDTCGQSALSGPVGSSGEKWGQFEGPRARCRAKCWLLVRSGSQRYKQQLSAAAANERGCGIERAAESPIAAGKLTVALSLPVEVSHFLPGRLSRRALIQFSSYQSHEFNRVVGDPLSAWDV